MATSIPSSPSSPGVTCFRPLPLSGAEKRFITYVDRFRFGEESARAVLNSVCPDPIRPVLSGLIDVLDFLAGNYLLLVSNKEAAANLGFSCSRAAESICTLVRTSASHSWAVDPSNHAVPDFVDLLTQIIEYVNDALAPRSKNYYRRVKDLVQVRKVKEELERFGKKLNDQLAMIQFSVNVSNHEALANLLAKEKADNRLLDDHSKQRQEEELQEIKSAGISIQVEAAKLGDAVPEVVRHKLEDIVLAVRKRGILIRQETQLGNLSLEESDLIKIDTEVDMVVALAHKVEKQFGLPLHLEQWMISSRDVQFQEVDDFCLGRGVSSIVYKGKMAGRGFVAVKVFKFDDVTPDKIERSITKEIESWRMVSDHPTILTLFGISTKIKYFLVSELCESTARKHLSVIRRSKTTAEWSNAVSSVLADTADALRFIHQQNIVHHDVKGNNILIRRDGSAALGDFDLARTIGSLSSTTTTQTKGTLNWCSPEQLLGPLSQLTAKTDTWSFGMTIFELLKDDNPYGDYLDAKSLIVADSPTLPTAADIPTELSFLVDLAMNCCKKHPADRNSDDEIMACFPAAKGPSSVNDEDKYPTCKQKAMAGDADAQNRLGDMCNFGRNVEKDLKQAVEWYRKSALQGNATAQCNLGLMYKNGQGVEQDDKQAVEWYQKSALQGYARGQCNLGFMYQNGLGVEQDHKQAVEWYQKSALQRNARGQCNLGVMYQNGLGVEQDHKQAVEWYQKSALQGNALGQCNLGLMYKNGLGVEQDDKQAVEWYRKSALQGNANAQCNLGFMFEMGLGVEQDHKQAVEWYRKSALQGNADGQCSLGFMYHNGLGVEQDHNQAVEWYRKSALEGNARGQRNLGFMYCNGLGVEQDHKQAVKWYQKSALQGNANAQCKLGVMYKMGLGVEQDHKQAVEWYRKSALQGYATAQCNLGFMYHTGLGVEQDHKQAVKWYQKSALQGNADGQRNLGVMYCNGLGVVQDHNQAVEWLQKSATQGDAYAQHNLGVMYKRGWGVKQDHKQAVKWFQKSALQGNATAQYKEGIMYRNGLGAEQDYKQAVELKSALQGNESGQKNVERMTKKKWSLLQWI